MDMILIPVPDAGGQMPFSSAVGRAVTPNAMGMDGPVTSASMMATDLPRRAWDTASRLVTLDLPTPPLPDTTPMTFFTRLPGFGFSRKLFVSRLSHSTPQLSQLCVHSSLMTGSCNQ